MAVVGGRLSGLVVGGRSSEAGCPGTVVGAGCREPVVGGRLSGPVVVAVGFAPKLTGSLGRAIQVHQQNGICHIVFTKQNLVSAK